jgi:hypothetical protein
MEKSTSFFSVEVEETEGRCPIGEKIGKQNQTEGKIPDKKYTDIFDIDGVPEKERNQVARDVADWVIVSLE